MRTKSPKFDYARFGNENLVNKVRQSKKNFFSRRRAAFNQLLKSVKEFVECRNETCRQLGEEEGQEVFDSWLKSEFSVFAKNILIAIKVYLWYSTLSLSDSLRRKMNARGFVCDWAVLDKLPHLPEEALPTLLRAKKIPNVQYINKLIQSLAPTYFIPKQKMTQPYYELAGKTFKLDNERLEALEQEVEKLAQLDPTAINKKTGEVRVLQKHALEVLKAHGYDVSQLVKPVKTTRTQLLQQDNQRLNQANQDLLITNQELSQAHNGLKNQIQELDAKLKLGQRKSELFERKSIRLGEKIETIEEENLTLVQKIRQKNQEIAELKELLEKTPREANQEQESSKQLVQTEIPQITSNGKIPNGLGEEFSPLTEDFLSDGSVEVVCESNDNPTQTEEATDNISEQPVISDSNSILDETEEQLTIDALTEALNCSESLEETDTGNDEQLVVEDVVEAEGQPATLSGEASQPVDDTDKQLESASSNGSSKVQFSAVNQKQVQDKQQFKGKKVKINKQSGVALEEIEMEKINRLCNHKRNKKSSQKSAQKKAFVVAGCR